MATAEELYGKDIAFQSDFVRSSSGDLDTVEGLPNLKEAVLRRIFTQPGSIIHRPNYGVGLKSFLNGLNSFGIQQKLALKIKEQLEQDPRIEKFLGLRVDYSDSAAGLVKIFIRYIPVGYSEQTLSISEVA